MTRIAFCADLHVDQYGSKVDPSTGMNARLLDYLRTVRHVAQEARDRGCDALVVAGDVTERKHVNSWLAGKIGEALGAGPDRLFVLRGNHDGEIAGESIVTVLGRMAPGWVGIPRPRVSLVGDTGLAFIPHLDGRWLRTQDGMESIPPQEINRVLAEQYLVLARALYAELDASGSKLRTRILVAHQGMSGGAMSEAQAAFLGDRSLVVDAAALGAIGYDAIVAGHFHRHQVLSTDPLTLYTGSVERVDFAEEHEDKGFVVIDTDDLPAFEFVETPARRYVTLDWSTPDRDWPVGDLTDLVNQAIVRVLNADPETDATELRETLSKAGAFDVTEIRKRRVEQATSGGMAEDLAPEAALEAYFADDPEAEAIVARGREILAEVG